MANRQREYHKEYYQRPGPKEKRRIRAKAYHQRPEVKAKVRDKMRERYHRPEIQESLRLLRQEPAIQERERKRRQNPEAKAKAKAYHLRRNYGLTWEAYESMIAGQGAKCAACGTEDWGQKGPAVDHDHNTGAVRGIVCHQCNIAIGLIRDDPQRARAIADYLEASQRKAE